MDVRVDGHRRSAEAEQQDDRRRLAADPGQRRQPLACLGERHRPQEAEVPGAVRRGMHLREDVLDPS